MNTNKILSTIVPVILFFTLFTLLGCSDVKEKDIKNRKANQENTQDTTVALNIVANKDDSVDAAKTQPSVSPPVEAEEIAEKSRIREEKEAKFMEQLLDGANALELFGFDKVLEKKGCTYKD